MMNDRQAASILMLKAIQMGFLNEARREDRSPLPQEAVAAGLLALLSHKDNGMIAAGVSIMDDAEKEKMVRMMGNALTALLDLDEQRIKYEEQIKATKERLPADLRAVAENHECEKCPAYDECDLPSVSEGGPRKELKAGEWNPLPMPAERAPGAGDAIFH